LCWREQCVFVRSTEQCVFVRSTEQGVFVRSTEQDVFVRSTEQGVFVRSTEHGVFVRSTEQGVFVRSTEDNGVVSQWFCFAETRVDHFRRSTIRRTSRLFAYEGITTRYAGRCADGHLQICCSAVPSL
jgi:hypothetical protein